MNICLHVLVRMSVFNYLGYISKSGNPGSCGKSMFHFLRKRQVMSHRGWTVLQSHQQCLRVSHFSTFSPVLVISPPFCFCFCFHLFIWLQPFWYIWNDTPLMLLKTEIRLQLKTEIEPNVESRGIISALIVYQILYLTFYMHNIIYFSPEKNL